MDLLRDRLFEIFDRHHQEGKWQTHSQEEFLFRIVEEYVIELIRIGHIPIHYLETIREDLEAEVLEMYRKKTYGQVTQLAKSVDSRRKSASQAKIKEAASGAASQNTPRKKLSR